MNTEVLRKTLTKSLAGTITFPEVVGLLSAEGVESYHADLMRLEKTFYMPNADTYVEKMEYPAKAIGEQFSAENVVSALRDIQAGKIQYRDFLDLVMDAGTTNYVVYLQGRRAIYFGRKGDFHIEEFPQPRDSARAESTEKAQLK